MQERPRVQASCSIVANTMIVDSRSDVVLSCLGWVDRGALWRFDGQSGQQDSIPLSNADYVRLFRGKAECFAVQHIWQSGRFRMTAHAWSVPEQTLSSIEVGEHSANLDGDASVWASLPSTYVGPVAAGPSICYRVLALDDATPRTIRLDWFDDYDPMYQSVGSAQLLPGSKQFVVGIQRSSDLVIIDADDGHVVRRVPLADRHGNPHPILSTTGQNVWAADYDTLVRLDTTTWQVAESALLQPAREGTGMFIGDLWVTPDESEILVPRPGSGDVLVLDSESLAIHASVYLGSEPLVAVALADGRIVARDWMTGSVLLGQLDRP